MDKCIIVCEGIHDEERIRKVFHNAFCITTNGSEISDETLKMIKEYSKDYKIIIFTDPDQPGERIRHRVLEVVPNACEAFLPKKICISKNHKKVGIEHAPLSDIKDALENYIDKDAVLGSLELNDLYDLGLVGASNSSMYRANISAKLNIGNPNAKTFLKRVNALGITKEQLLKMIGEVNE
ncbi:MAG: ribonuclease M5 [Acholeplasmatales bacterium]|nr:ribonuclease M5 [Acholeplasmatales bacterium]